MNQIDAAGILDIDMSGKTAIMLARRMESALLVNVDKFTLARLIDFELLCSLNVYNASLMNDAVFKFSGTKIVIYLTPA